MQLRTMSLLSLMATLLVTSFTSPAHGQSTNPEFRAMWISRFEWPKGDEATIKARIDTMMQELAAHNFNAVFFQVRGQADTFYPSPYEIWSNLINGGVDPGWDPLAYAIDAAHANGLKFHAYINTHTCWQSGAGKDPAAGHLFFAHCRASDPDHRDWLIHDSAGNPVQYHENDYVWIAPGVPAFQAYIRKQVMYVVENYDVDGIHFDRIRTPNSLFSYDPISQARRADPQSNPNALDFSHWTRDQITRNVRDMYAAIMSVKPHLVVSAAVFQDSATAPASVHQDALTWAQTGGMDMLVPMMYTSGVAGSTWDSRLIAWLAGSGGRQVVAGQGASVGSSMLQQQIELTRTRGGAGNSVFSWDSFASFDSYLGSVYQASVAPPAMTWKTAPQTGIVFGYVTDAAGQPVVDAQLRRGGSTYVGLSTGDGFYSFLQVPPGTYTLEVTHRAYDPVSVANVTVTAGQVKRQDIALGAQFPPIITEVTPDPDATLVTRQYTRQLTLAQGLATGWTLLQAPPGTTISNTGTIRGWTPTAADVNQTFTFTARVTSSAGVDDETWQVRVDPLPDCYVYKLTGFEARDDAAMELFQKPRTSGTTVDDLATSPNVAEVTSQVTAFKGNKCLKVQWQYLDTLPERWMRLTTSNAPFLPNPTVDLERPIRFRLRVDSGRFRLCIGIRETETNAAIGANGGTVGSIEWVGAPSVINGAPQGVLVEAIPGVWQTFEFKPLADPISSFTGNAQLLSPNGKGVFEHIAFSVVDTVGPITVYIDDVDFTCHSSPFGDLNGDGYVDAADFLLFSACGSGPAINLNSGCQSCDADLDSDVDNIDFAAFQRCYSGILPQVNVNCAR